jgi:hypothetical protein
VHFSKFFYFHLKTVIDTLTRTADERRGAACPAVTMKPKMWLLLCCDFLKRVVCLLASRHKHFGFILKPVGCRGYRVCTEVEVFLFFYTEIILLQF